MQTRSICCKLLASPIVLKSLKETSQRFADACDYILKIATEHQASNAIKLHKLCYYDCRGLFELPANLVVRAIRRVSACMTRLKGQRKQPRKFSPKSIDFDARLFYYDEETESVLLTTAKGRFRIPLKLGEYQRRALIGKNPTSATVINKNGVWYIHIVVEFEAVSCSSEGIMGIDLGINNIATTSTGLQIEGTSRQKYKQKKAQVRASLQSKNTRGTKKVLKKLSGNEHRRIKHENHVLSKELVEEAKRHDCGIIRMEQLKDIRSKTKTWNKHRNRMMASWSFYQLQQFVTYKAAAFGIAVEFVNPAYTSQTCHRCLKLGSRNGSFFTCLTCGEQHADVNASQVIALGGAACKPARISTHRVAKSFRL